MKQEWLDGPTCRMILDVVRDRIRTSMDLFKVMTTQTAFPLRIKKDLEEEIGEELPNHITLLGVTVYWQEEGKG
jgi:hypothetical protein